MKKLSTHFVMFSLGVVCLAYMLNLTLGIDLIPDNLPFIGNLDDMGATAILLAVMAYFGMDTTAVGRLLRDWVDDRHPKLPRSENEDAASSRGQSPS